MRVARSSSRPRPDRRRADHDPPAPVTLLVADDHEHFRAGLIRMLERRPSVQIVGVASDGLGALELIRERRPRIAVVDLRMPSLNGLGVARAVRDDPSLHDTQVVVLSAWADAGLVAQAIEAGAVACLDKAAPRQVLHDELLRIADRRRAG